jgi:hypothetical protein
MAMAPAPLEELADCPPPPTAVVQIPSLHPKAETTHGVPKG